jgi:hypothetical protein
MSILYRRCYFINTFYGHILKLVSLFVFGGACGAPKYDNNKEHSYDSIFTIRLCIG